MPERKTKTVVSNTTPLVTLTSIPRLYSMLVKQEMVKVDIFKLALLKGAIALLLYPKGWKSVLKTQKFGRLESVF